jgi:hypothetical protein
MLIAFGVPPVNWMASVSIYQILVAFCAGISLQPCVIAVRLLWRYHGVSGRYSAERVYANGKTENRFGEIRIKFKWWRGSYSVTASHADESPQWEGEMRLSLDMRNVGHGVFWHVDKDDGAGDQKYRYYPEQKQFEVEGITFKAGGADSFFHRWRKK